MIFEFLTKANLSHVGMVIQTTTLDTEEKVKKVYGGNTWTKIEGKMLLGASASHAVNTTGGSETNTLSVANLPSHTHGLNNHTHGIPALSGTAASAGAHSHTITHMMMWDSNWTTTNGWTAASSQTYRYDAKASCSTDGAHTHSVTTNASTTGGNGGNTTATGSGTAVNNMPPYKVVYIWERTA